MKPDEGNTGVEKHECEFFLCQDDRAYLCECGLLEFNHVTFYPEEKYQQAIAALKELNEAFYKIESILTEDSDILWLNETEWKEIKSAIENAKSLITPQKEQTPQ